MQALREITCVALSILFHNALSPNERGFSHCLSPHMSPARTKYKQWGGLHSGTQFLKGSSCILLRSWPSAVVITEERNRCFLYWETTLSTFTTIHGAFVPGRNEKDMNQLAKTHISSLGETSPAATSCSLTNSCSCTGLSSLPPWPLGRLLSLFFTPAVASQCLEQSKMFHLLTTEDKQAKEKEKNRGNQCWH